MKNRKMLITSSLLLSVVACGLILASPIGGSYLALSIICTIAAAGCFSLAFSESFAPRMASQALPSPREPGYYLCHSSRWVSGAGDGKACVVLYYDGSEWGLDAWVGGHNHKFGHDSSKHSPPESWVNVTDLVSRIGTTGGGNIGGPTKELVGKVVEAAASYTGTSPGLVFSRSRKREAVNARMMAAAVLCDLLGYNLSIVGKYLGRDHSTVSHAIKSHWSKINTDAGYTESYTGLVEQLSTDGLVGAADI